MDYRSSFIALIACTVLFAGCNAFGGMEGAPETTQEFLSSAESALAQGHDEEAVELLEEALEKDPESKEVRVELASAKMQKEDVTLVELQSMASEYQADWQSSSVSSSVRGRTASAERVCSFNPDEFPSTPLQPTEWEAYRKLKEKRAMLVEVKALVNYVLFGKEEIDEATITQEDLQRAVAALAEDGFSEERIAKGLLLQTIAYTGVALIDLIEGARQHLTFYRYETDGSTYPGYCAATQQALDQVLSQVACQFPTVEHAIGLIKARAVLLESEQANRIADEAAEFAVKMRDSIDAECAASARIAQAVVR